MKKMFKSMLAVAAVAMAFTSCSKDETESPVAPVEMKTITVVAGSELEGDTRTTLDPTDNSVSWNATGEYLKVFETVGDVTTAANSGEGVVVGGQALFEVAFTKNETATSFTYNAVYPAAAWMSDETINTGKVKLLTPAAQKPSLTSFDGNADLLIAKPETKTEQPATFEAYYKRIVAIGKMTITGLDTEDAITSVKFTAKDEKLNGRSYVDLINGVVSEYGYYGATDNIELMYPSDLGFKNNGTAYFTCFPVEIAEGDAFSVTVLTETNKSYTKEVTVPAGKSLVFTAGKSSKFTVDMTGIEGVTVKTLSGQHLVIAEYEDVFYAMSSEAEGSRLAYSVMDADFATDVSAYPASSDNLIWDIQKIGDNYALKNIGNSNYLAWGSGNSATTAEGAYALNISENENGTYTIKSVADATRILAKNTSSKYGFAFYASSGVTELYLIPVGEDTRKTLETPQNVTATVVEGTPNAIKIEWDAVENATGYVVSYDTVSVEVETTSTTIENLQYAMTYEFSVVAKAQGFKQSDAATATATTDAKPEGSGATTYTEDFSGFTTANNSYSNNGTYNSVANAVSWTYAHCALNQNNAKFVLGKSNAGAYIQSSTLSDGVSEITINWIAPFSSDKLQIDVYVNDTLVKEVVITATSGDTGTETITGINVSGDAVIKLAGHAKVGSKDNRPGITGISWVSKN